MAAKKSSKSIDVISSLRAFETTLRAACRSYGVPVPRPLLEEVIKGQEASQHLTAVILSGSAHPGHVTAVADCLASYGAAKSLSCLGCAVGDKGLAAIAALLQSSGSKWWHGCRLTSLELSNTRQGSACTPTQRSAASSPSGTPHGAHAEQHSSWLQRDSVRPATAPPTHASGSQQQRGAAPLRPYTGVCPPLPGYLQEQASSQHTQDDRRLAQPVALRQIRYTVRSPKAMHMEFKAWALARAPGSMQHTDRAPGSPPPGSPTAVSSRVFEDAPCCFGAAPLQQLSLALGVMNLQLQRLVLDHTRLGDQGISILTTGLANCSCLKVLSLRYCGIGPAGAQCLAAGLVPACRKHLGNSTPAATAAAGPAGSRMSMGSVNPQLVTAPDTSAVSSNTVGRSSSTATTSSSAAPGSSPSASREPLLLELHMSGNPLGAAGLHAVNKAVRLMPSIKVLTLADISLDCNSVAAQLEVQVLAHSLLAGPNELSTLDFTDNLIGDECALYFVGLLKGKASITLLKLTPRLGNGVMQQMSELLEEHQRAAKAARASKKPKKKA